MGYIHSSSTNSQGPFSPYQLLPDDAKAEVMKHSSLKQLDAGLAKSDKTSNRVALDLVRTVALQLTQVVDTREALWKDLNQAISEKASDSKVHDAFKAVIKTCGFENVPLMDVALHIQARQEKAAHCGISLGEYQEILRVARSKTATREDIESVVEDVSRAKGVDFKELSMLLLSDRDLALAFVQKDPSIYEPMALDRKYPMIYELLSPEFQADREITLAAVTGDAGALYYASAQLKADKEVVLAAVAQNGLVLKHANPKLQADKEVVLAALAEDGDALQFASKELQADKGVVMTAVTKSGSALQYASLELGADKEVVLAAVAANDWALQHASPKLKDDKEFILALFKMKIAGAWKFASPELKADKELFMAALIVDAFAEGRADLEDASSALRADKEVVLAAVMRNGWALQAASPALQADKEVVMAAIKENPHILKCVSPKLRADKEIIMAAVMQDGYLLQYTTMALQADKEVVLAAVTKTRGALTFASKELQTDPDILAACGHVK